ncbi:unnamed protein product, partial [Prorocentrum cordatum]
AARTGAAARIERDMRALGDSQTRLFHVIEEVSQELTQRLGAHEAAIGELRRAGAEGAARRDASAAEAQAMAQEVAGLRRRQSEQAGGVDAAVGRVAERLEGAVGRLAEHEMQLQRMEHRLRHVSAEQPAQLQQHELQLQRIELRLQQVSAEQPAQQQQHELQLQRMEQRLQQVLAEQPAQLQQQLEQRMQQLEQRLQHLAMEQRQEMREAQLQLSSRMEGVRASGDAEKVVHQGEALRLGASVAELQQQQQALQQQLAARDSQHAAVAERLHAVEASQASAAARHAEELHARRGDLDGRVRALEQKRFGQDIDELRAKLAALGGDVVQLQRQDADRRQKRLALLKAEVARHQDIWDANNTTQLSEPRRDQSASGEELQELRRSTSDVASRVGRCESGLEELRQQVGLLRGCAGGAPAAPPHARAP